MGSEACPACKWINGHDPDGCDYENALAEDQAIGRWRAEKALEESGLKRAEITRDQIEDEQARLEVMAVKAIKRVMTAKGVSAKNVADRLGYDPDWVRGVLDGKEEVGFEVLAAFGAACGIWWTFLGLEQVEGAPDVERDTR
jgi:hypothetical protein